MCVYEIFWVVGQSFLIDIMDKQECLSHQVKYGRIENNTSAFATLDN